MKKAFMIIILSLLPFISFSQNTKELFEIVVSKIDAKNFKGAILDLNKIINNDANDLRAYNIRGYCFNMTKEYNNGWIQVINATSKFSFSF